MPPGKPQKLAVQRGFFVKHWHCNRMQGCLVLSEEMLCQVWPDRKDRTGS